MANTKETKKTEKKNNVHEVIVKIEGVEWTEALDKAFKSKQKDAKVDGFRKGKVPRNIYEKHYGKESLFFLAAEEVLQSAYAKAMEESNLIPVVQPSVDIKDISDKGVEFTFKIITKPEVKIKNYKGLGIKPEEIKVTKDEIDHEIGHLLEEYTELVTKEGEVKNGDVAVIDFEGFKDGKPFDGGKGENYSLEIGSNTFIPGFEEQVIGMKTGEEKDLTVSFPEDYGVEDLKGQPVIFKVKVNEIKEKVTRELDKEFFEDLAMEGVHSKETLEKEVEKNIKAQKEADNENKYIDHLLEEVAKTGIARIRFTTSHPWDFSREMIEIINQYDNIMPYIHLPVQSGNTEILKLMGRRYTREQYLELFHMIKEVMPDCSITTDIIVGFPNETEEQFQDTLSLISWHPFQD